MRHVAGDLTQVRLLELRFSLLDEVTQMVDDAAGSQRLARGVPQQFQELLGSDLAGAHVARARAHPVYNRRQRLVELVSQATGELADGADAQGVRQLGLPLPDL